ncbi:prevent-host-death family protein [Rickettsia bellii str. RML Mogi]|uniref:Prevent-host-death family protein n=1 Tax=Rickettsia bellii str. RML Mogi TaxID=1359194 RepID=A0A0F3QJG2_RICBE|nr:prevent-host-death family protein [Rickettsia bellii str. RML Mogi]
MNKWQLHEAKNKLSNIVDTAMQGTPQCIIQKGEKKQL